MSDDVNADQPWDRRLPIKRYAAVVQTNHHRRNDRLVGNAGGAGCNGRSGLTEASDVQLNIFASLRRIGGAHLDCRRAEPLPHRFCRRRLEVKIPGARGFTGTITVADASLATLTVKDTADPGWTSNGTCTVT